MFEEQKEKLLNWGTAQLEKERNRKELVRVIFFSILGEIGAIVIAIMVPKPVVDAAAFAVSVEGKIVLYLLAVPFVCGFMVAFASIKLVFPKKKTHSIQRGSFLRGYEEHSFQEDQRFVFLICAAVGGLNALIFFFLATGLR